MDTATAGGGDELRSGASEGVEEGAEEPESEGKVRSGVSRRLQARERGRRWQAGAGACGLRGRSLAVTTAALGRGEEDDKRSRGAGPPAGLPSSYSSGPQVGAGKSFCSILYFLFCFLFSVIVFGFIKNARAFPKIMKLLNVTVWNISNSKHFSL